MQLVYEEPHFEFRGVVESYCHLRIWRSAPLSDPDIRAVVLATDPEQEDAGTSITNAVEVWAQKARGILPGVPLERITFIEHYPHTNDPAEVESFDAVFFSEGLRGGRDLHSPAWQRLDRVWVEAVIGGPLE